MNISSNLKILDIESANMLLAQKVDSNVPFFVSRIGFGELERLVARHLGGRSPVDKLKFIKGLIMDPIHTLREERIWKSFSQHYLDGYLAADIQCVWSGTRIDEQMKLFSKCKEDVAPIDALVLSPYHLSKPWTASLAGKQVLLISPFVDDFQEQHLKREKIWAGRESILPDFDLISYKTDFYFNKDTAWIDVLSKIKNDISVIDFDVALISCGPIGTPLGAYIRNKMKRSAIYMGAALQTLFGVTGARWDSHEYIQQFVNDSWIRPTGIKPKGAEKLDNSCYW